MSEDKETQVMKVPTATVGKLGIQVENLEQMWWLANKIMQSGLAPKECKTVPDLVVRAQFGMSVGLSFMQSIQAIAVINGRPSMWGHHVVGVIMSSGKVKTWKEEIVREPNDNFTVRITTERSDVAGLHVVEFSTAMARKAKLMDKDLYKLYPEDMIHHKCVARVAKRVYADVMSGLGVAEDERDIIDVTPEATVVDQKPTTLSGVAEKVKQRRSKAADPEPPAATEPKPESNNNNEEEVPVI